MLSSPCKAGKGGGGPGGPGLSVWAGLLATVSHVKVAQAFFPKPQPSPVAQAKPIWGLFFFWDRVKPFWCVDTPKEAHFLCESLPFAWFLKCARWWQNNAFHFCHRQYNTKLCFVPLTDFVILFLKYGHARRCHITLLTVKLTLILSFTVVPLMEH